MRHKLILNNPTPLCLAAVQFKGVPAEINIETEKGPLGFSGPSIQQNHLIAVGQDGVLNFLDRRFPLPNIFPENAERFSRAITIKNCIETGVFSLDEVWAALKESKSEFLTGNKPCIADLMFVVAVRELEAEFEFSSFIHKVMAYGIKTCGYENFDEKRARVSENSSVSVSG